MLLTLIALAIAATPPKLKFSAWVVLWDGGEAVKSFEQKASRIDEINVDWISMDKQGSPVRAALVTEQLKQRIFKTAHLHHIKTFGLAANSSGDDFNGDYVHTFLADPQKSDMHARALVDIVVKDGLDGLDLDYESLKAEDRDRFSDFVALLAQHLHAKKKLLSIAVHAKEGEPGNWNGAQAQDWTALGKAVDRFRIMGYDEHETGSVAGPVASTPWIKRVLAFAVSVVPKGKIDLGIPGYGYDWSKKPVASLDWPDFQRALAGRNPIRDAASSELTFNYPEGGAIWFADGASIAPKIEEARRLGIRGLVLWRLGSEDPDLWNYLGK